MKESGMNEDDMNRNVAATVVRYLGRHVSIEVPLDPTLDLVEDLKLDSLDQLALVVELENHFRICIEPSDEASLSTLRDVVALVERRIAAEPEAAHV